MPACRLPRNYGEKERPLLDWHKYDLCIIAAKENIEFAKEIRAKLWARNKEWRIYLDQVDHISIGERQELFIRNVFYAASWKCLALLSIHMVHHPRRKSELNHAMQRGQQLDNEACRDYLIPVAIDEYGLAHMTGDDYLRNYAENLEIIQDKETLSAAIVKKLLDCLENSIYYIPPENTDNTGGKKKRFSVALVLSKRVQRLR